MTRTELAWVAVTVLGLSCPLGCGGASGQESETSETDTDTGTDTDADTGPALEVDDCPKLHALIDGACEPVSVTEITAREFSFERGGWTLEGTLVEPVVAAGEYLPVGAVIFHGSGPQGRLGYVEATLGVTYPEPVPIYGSLAEQLVSLGFSVLVYDKRSCFAENNSYECDLSAADYPGDPNAMLITDFLEDARSATRALSTELGGAEVVAFGHSQGALFVPILAAEEEVVCAGAMLAGPALSLADTIRGQLEDYADYLEAIDPSLPEIAELRAAAQSYADALAAIADGSYGMATFEGVPVEVWLGWIHLQDGHHDALAAVERPLFAAFGGADFNVGPAHVAQFEDWVSMGVRADVQLEVYAEYPHGFTPPVDGGGYELRFSPEVVADIGAWLGR